MGDQAQAADNRPSLESERMESPAQAPAQADVFANSELSGMRSAIADAATVASGLWISFLFTLFYLAIAAAGVTHRDLLFESPIKLPFLNTELPMTAFFTLGPMIFFIVHANLLIYFVFLANKIQQFNQKLREINCLSNYDASLRDQLPSNTFVQVLAGPPQFRHGWFGDVLGLISMATLAMAPLALLLLFQIQFLPYHGEAELWLQRCIVALDAAILWALWPHVWLSADDNHSLFTSRRLSYFFVLILGAASILFSITVATFPYEQLEKYLPRMAFIPVNTTTGYDDNGDPQKRVMYYSLHDVLFGGAVDRGTEQPKSLWSNRLFLAEFDPGLGGDATDRTPGRPFNLRGRRLEGAIMFGANLREVDFSGARLQGAYLIHADLRGAQFRCAATDLYPDANALAAARISEGCTHLEGATLDGALLEDADLDDAQLQGASLRWARLQGATLDRANLEGADLENAVLDATSLDSTDLRAARLVKATLRGAALRSTQLQAADLASADIASSVLDGVYLWRTNLVGIVSRDNLVTGAISGARQQCPRSPGTSCLFGPADYAALEHSVRSVLPATGNLHGDRNLNRDRALARLAGSLDPATPTQGGQAAGLAALAGRPPPDERDFEESQAAQWRKTACAIDDEPYPLWGVVERLGEDAGAGSTLDPAQLALIRSLLKGENCPGMSDLATNRKQRLEKLLWNSP
jgi:uncharacterized protein YjbI with pentapeptide repeats